MYKLNFWHRILVLAVICLGVSGLAYALMPPEVYRKAIADSPVKAVAIVKKVTVTEKTKFYIEKKVEFELVKSYGLLRPGKIFYGWCKSATENEIVGGTIYYYPAKGEEVFVTLDGVSSGDDSGYITSYTEMDDELRNVLERIGVEGLAYGLGEVRPKH